MVAAMYGQLEAGQLLLDRGAQIDARDKLGNTALILAACECAQATMPSTYETVQLLLDRGANVNARNHEGKTALIDAAGGFGGNAIVRLLLDRGADAKLKDKEGKSALDYARESEKNDAMEMLKTAMAGH